MSIADNGPGRVSAAGRKIEVSARGLLLESRDRADHPHAREETCSIRKPHTPHPYGPIHAGGGLTYWCPRNDRHPIPEETP